MNESHPEIEIPEEFYLISVGFLDSRPLFYHVIHPGFQLEVNFSNQLSTLTLNNLSREWSMTPNIWELYVNTEVVLPLNFHFNITK